MTVDEIMQKVRQLTEAQKTRALLNILEALYPSGDIDGEWDSETADDIAHIFFELK